MHMEQSTFVSNEEIMKFIGAERSETVDFIVGELQRDRVDLSLQNKNQVLQKSKDLFDDLMKSW